MPTYTAYIRIQRDFLSVRVVARKGAGGYYEDVPQFAYHTHSKQVLAYGSAATPYADARGYEMARVFHHPRLVVHDLEHTYKVLRYFLDQALHRRIPFLRLHFVLHLLDTWEGGVTDVEKTALIQVCRDLGAKGIVLCLGSDEISEAEVLGLTQQLRGNEFYEAT
jgi:MreB/Mbl protein